MVATSRHTKGVLLTLAVVLLWVGSSVAIKEIFHAGEFKKPFFLTYFSTSLFTLYLLGFFCRPAWRAGLRRGGATHALPYTQLPAALEGDGLGATTVDEADGVDEGAEGVRLAVVAADDQALAPPSASIFKGL